VATGIPVSVGELVDVIYLNEVARAHYRKTTLKTVNATVAATDLLNGEITIDAGAMSLTRLLRLTAWGDFLNNVGSSQAPPRFQLVFGGTTLFDTNTSGLLQTFAQVSSWRMTVEIANLAANSQFANLSLTLAYAGQVITTPVGVLFAAGNGVYQSVGQAASAGSTWTLLAQGNALAVVNTALAAPLVLNVINASASAAYSTRLYGAVVEVV
jgi:hypothetical protein